MTRPPVLPEVADAMWRSPSGATVTPTQVVDALCAALSTLTRNGWQPGGVHEAIDNPDVRCIADRCLDLVVTYRTAGQWTSYATWEQMQGRTFSEVQDIVTATIAYTAAATGGA